MTTIKHWLREDSDMDSNTEGPFYRFFDGTWSVKTIKVK